jgi:cyclic-di-GMP phosphodiesterase TipF (flagellum assembly factor)
MKRVLLAILLVAFLGGSAWWLYTPVDGWPMELRLGIIAAMTLVIAVAAALAAAHSLRRVNALHTDLTVLARSMDLALRDFAQRNTKDVATIGEMNEQVARELEKIAVNLLHRDEPPAAAPPPVDNVVPMPAPKRARNAAAEAASAAPDRGAIEAAYRKALALGSFEISLQPIVSITKSAAAGFEAFACLPVDGRAPVHLRRLAESLPGTNSASFERILVEGALQAGRRRLGNAGEGMLIHVAVSEALLSDTLELDGIAGTIALYPELAKSVLLAVPVALFDPKADVADALSRLAAIGVRFAAEGWVEGTDSATGLAEAGVTAIKISAHRLLDRDRSKRKLAPAMEIVETASAADLTVVATEVATDEDAVSLIDLGIEMMIGERFSGPRRLKSEGDRTGRMSLI